MALEQGRPNPVLHSGFLPHQAENASTISHECRSDLELVLLAVDDDSSDLLVHKYEDGAEQCGKCRHGQRPPGI